MNILYLHPPTGFNPCVDVVACYIKCNDQILILRRHPLKPEGNTWCVPGGKKEKTESLVEAMQRELKEESGIIVSENALQYVCKTYARYPNMDFTYHLFRADLAHFPLIQLSPTEHEAFQWVTLPEAYRLPLTPGTNDALKILFETVLP